MDSKKDKVSRTVKLNEDLNQRLLDLCDHLGVNPNAYLLNEIGKCISRDEVSYLSTKNTNDANNHLNELFSLLASNAQEQEK